MEQDETIRKMWGAHGTAEISRATGLAVRTVRWRARKLGLSPHRRGPKRQETRSIAERPRDEARALPGPVAGKRQAAPRLPADFVAFRPGDAPQSPAMSGS